MTVHRSGGAARLCMAAAPFALLVLMPRVLLAADTDADTDARVDDRPATPLKIEINRYALSPSASSRVEVVPQDAPPAPDVGGFLLSQPGVSGGRMGGHGTEIIIRGQSQDRLAVINDGTYTFGGCPNRMDPPAAIASLEATDVITIKRGYQSVTEGPPAPGGTVRLERATPTFTEPGVTGSVSGGIQGNGMVRRAGADVSAGMEEGYARAFYGISRSDNYEDGGGTEIRSAFKQHGGGLDLGWTYAPGSVLSLAAERDDASDTLFAGAGMDSPESITTTYRAQWRHEVMNGGPLTLVEGGLYTSMVDHLMDNYSLRVVTAPMKMVTPTESNTWGGRLAAGLSLGMTDLTVGIDHRVNERTAMIYRGPVAAVGDPATLFTALWPGVEIEDTGLFAEAKTPLAPRTDLTAGLRLDRVSVDAGKADLDPPGAPLTPRQIYAKYYGETDVSQEELNLSGLLRLDHAFSDGLAAWAGISRSVRTADATERGIARDSGPTAWVGNPAIKPEKHHQVDAGLRLRRDAWAAGASAWGDWVSDFISRDTARGQSGILVATGGTVYRNVDAVLAGLELEGAWAPWEEIRLSGNATYTWGENTTDDRALYQIPPLQGAVEGAWEPGDWGVGSRMRWALKQGRIDGDAAAGAGIDPRKTPGYAVFDLFASYDGIDGLTLKAGVANVFDRTYASHISRSNAVDPTLVQVNEPGRSLYLQGSLTF